MVQESSGVDLTPWQPTPTVIPPGWQKYVEDPARKAKAATNLIAGMRYDGQETAKLLSEWGVPWQGVVAGALLFHNQKEFRQTKAVDGPQILSHIRQARRYMDCIEDEDLSTLLSCPYDDPGALLIAVASYYVALQGLRQPKSKRPSNQHEISRIESIGSTLLHITKRLNLWLFKRDVEDLILQLCDLALYIELEEEREQLLQRDAVQLNDFCQVAAAICEKALEKPIHITYSICGVSGFARRRQYIPATMAAQNIPLTAFDLAIFDVIVPTVTDCYNVLKVLSQFGYIQDRLTDQIAHPKPNGSSYLSFGLILEQEPYLHTLPWIAQNTYVSQLQIATSVMHAITCYGCLYPECYQLYTTVPLQESAYLPLEKLLASQDGKIFSNIVQSFKVDRAKKDVNAPIIVYDKKRKAVALPKGATVLDFAFLCNENITGSVYGFINDREVPLYHPLNAGDIVEIRNSNAPQTQEYWVERKYVTTSRALSAIQKQRFSEYKGYVLLRQKLERNRYKLTEDELSQELYDLVKRHHLGTVNAYLKQLDENEDLRYTPDWVAQQIMQQIKERNEQVVAGKPHWVARLDPQFANKHIYYLPKSSCNVCQPIYPRDSNIVGYVSKGEKTLVIHSAHCPRLTDRYHKQREPLYSLTWHLLPTFRVGFFATAQERRGLVFDVSKQLRHHQCVLVSMYAEAVYKDARLHFIVEIYDTGEVLDILQKLKKVKGIIDIDIDPMKTAPQVYEQLQHQREQPPLVAEKIEAEYAWEETRAMLGSRRPVLRNPFNISRPPGEKMFFGRTSEIKKLQRELCADERGKAIFLYGPRRSGKSSLCNHFLEHYVHPPYWHVHHSLQSATRLNETTILMQIAEEVCRAFQERFNQRPSGWQDYSADDPEICFKSVLQGCLSSISGSRLVLVLDEFGGVIEAHQKNFLDERFFTYWRNLIQEIPQLSLIFVLPTIPHSFLTSGQLSSAFSFMESHSMEFLDEASAQQLLINPLQEQDIAIHPGTVRQALSLTGCNPYYLTLIGSQLISYLNVDPHKHLLNNEDLDIAVEQLVKGNTKQNFYFYHDEIYPEEIPVVEAIVNITQQSGQPGASLKKIAARLHKPVEVLQPRLKRLQEGLILDELQTEWSSSQPYYAFTIELVRLWMAQNNQFFLSENTI